MLHFKDRINKQRSKSICHSIRFCTQFKVSSLQSYNCMSSRTSLKISQIMFPKTLRLWDVNDYSRRAWARMHARSHMGAAVRAHAHRSTHAGNRFSRLKTVCKTGNEIYITVCVCVFCFVFVYDVETFIFRCASGTH